MSASESIFAQLVALKKNVMRMTTTRRSFIRHVQRMIKNTALAAKRTRAPTLDARCSLSPTPGWKSQTASFFSWPTAPADLHGELPWHARTLGSALILAGNNDNNGNQDELVVPNADSPTYPRGALFPVPLGFQEVGLGYLFAPNRATVRGDAWSEGMLLGLGVRATVCD